MITIVGEIVMLNIVLGNKENVKRGPAWFRFNYRPEWFEDELVQRMIIDVDKSEYRGGELIYSEVLGPIPPERLSGGVQTLICIYKRPDLVFNATSCGDNCAKWLLEIGKREDVLVNLRYLMQFDGLDPFEILITNEDKIVRNVNEFMRIAINYV